MAMRSRRQHWYLEAEDLVRCPHCGEVDTDACDYPDALQRNGDTVKWKCERCGGTFTVTLWIEDSYEVALEIAGPLTPEGL